MSIEHALFIPACVLAGLVIGYVLGQRAVLADQARKNAKRRECRPGWMGAVRRPCAVDRSY